MYRPLFNASSATLVFKVIVLLLVFSFDTDCKGNEFAITDPATDYAFLEFEPYPSFTSGFTNSHVEVNATPMDGSSHQFWRLAGQIAFPAGQFYDHDLFGSSMSKLINRNITFHGTLLKNGR